MSSASSSSPPSASPSFDLDYSIGDFEVSPHRDSLFFYRRVDETLLSEGTLRGGRTLDVACGVGRLTVEVSKRGGEGWGLEPSPEMLGISRWLHAKDDAVLVRSIAEQMPFRDASFERMMCEGAIDHFVNPDTFMREAARVLKPDGRLVIAIANYASLSCVLGRALFTLAKDVLRRPQPPHRPYWQPPPDHFHMGHLSFVEGLAGNGLELERCYGISLLWLLYSWGKQLDKLPQAVTDPLLTGLDRIARRTPALADMIISVWRRPVESTP